MRFRKSSHAVYKTEYHIVWTPRYRRKIFVKGVKQYMEKAILGIGLDPDIEVIKINAQPDHIHVVIVIPPRVSVAEVMQFIKSQTGSLIKAKISFSPTHVLWQRRYLVTRILCVERGIL